MENWKKGRQALMLWKSITGQSSRPCFPNTDYRAGTEAGRSSSGDSDSPDICWASHPINLCLALLTISSPKGEKAKRKTGNWDKKESIWGRRRQPWGLWPQPWGPSRGEERLRRVGHVSHAWAGPGAKVSERRVILLPKLLKGDPGCKCRSLSTAILLM